jgi:TatD DNase family protein
MSAISLVDSHCHIDTLDLSLFDGKLENVIQRANDNGVDHFLCVCIDLENFPNVLRVAQQFDKVYATVGLHPNEKVDQEPTVEELIHLAQENKIIGIGETGLDYYRSEGDLDWQRQRFRTHIQAAKAVKKPLIVHTRDAETDTIEILKNENASTVRGILHCFTGSLEMALQAIDLGFYISFSGIISFPKATELQNVAKQLPLEKLLIETDCPYLAPIPFRGKPNEPAYVRYVAEALAKLKNISLEEVSRVTTKNYRELFGL